MQRTKGFSYAIYLHFLLKYEYKPHFYLQQHQSTLINNENMNFYEPYSSVMFVFFLTFGTLIHLYVRVYGYICM